ncbi:hypothetical protein CEUSTIGMA_g4220.t1 [Chlamydomonas eustigma]|uniref:Uncharacterized protein n=1 Tax=Chlamydomonas eustigma TaxID=1157962 RepID=A0A250X0Z7_9CHLO|nr:hypothetical protein CEUSTIGMA_g4220.t1 [Chlamydomonas eustigma]|eukprot:GAX76774.1 hypothetical protein CEUSTIGMA_g4220.t1 [Chlamydomonas eustigma]
MPFGKRGLWGFSLLMSAMHCFTCLTEAASDTKIRCWAKDKWYNPSLVEYNELFISAIKYTKIKATASGKAIWDNSLYMCEGYQKMGLESLRCNAFDPWKGQYRECDLDKRVRGGKMDMKGLGDVKVWRWPGKGVYAIFGRKPHIRNKSSTCDDLIVYHQWLVQVKTEGSLINSFRQSTVHTSSHISTRLRPHSHTSITFTHASLTHDPWMLQEPVPLLPAADFQYPESAKYVMEKNWMPFIYKDTHGFEHLYVTYMVQPHTVFEILPSGVSVHRWTTHDPTVMEKFASHDVHGGPPLVYVPASMSSSGEPYYLGIMHHIERFSRGYIRLYRHFAFMVKPEPPFDILGVSDELPLLFNTSFKRTSFVAFVSGLDLNKDGMVYVSYGSADCEARILTLKVSEMEDLFTGDVAFRNIVVPYEAVTDTEIKGTKARDQDEQEEEEAELKAEEEAENQVDLNGVEDTEGSEEVEGSEGNKDAEAYSSVTKD